MQRGHIPGDVVLFNRTFSLHPDYTTHNAIALPSPFPQLTVKPYNFRLPPMFPPDGVRMGRNGREQNIYRDR